MYIYRYILMCIIYTLMNINTIQILILKIISHFNIIASFSTMQLHVKLIQFQTDYDNIE